LARFHAKPLVQYCWILTLACQLYCVQAPNNRFSHNSDDELAPLATDLWSRLAQANSKIKSLQGEVASLQAQNTLLRQQVEQQQSQLDAGGRAWGGDGADMIEDECAEGFPANGYIKECAGGDCAFE
jgi:TolA-binding protein